MERELSIIELSRLVGELNTLSGFYIDKFYETDDSRFRIRVSRSGEKANINIWLPYYAIISDTADLTDEATNLTLAVRKKVDGAIVKSFSLLNRDRIILMQLGKKGEDVNLIFEMFGQGNMILADAKMVISLVYRPHEFVDRKLRKGETYTAPKNESIDFTNRKEIENEFAQLAKMDGEAMLAAHISRRLGIGTIYVRDAVIRADLDPKAKIKDVKQGGLKSVEERIISIAEASKSKGEVFLYAKEGTPVDFSICELAKYSDLKVTKFESVSKALEQLYSKKREIAQPKNTEKMERLRQSIAKQEHSIKRIEQESVESRAGGQFISSNATLINSAISYLKQNKTATEEELESVLGGFKVKKIDRKKRSFTLIVDKP